MRRAYLAVVVLAILVPSVFLVMVFSPLHAFVPLGILGMSNGITLSLDKSSYAYGDVIKWSASGFCGAGATCGSTSYSQDDQILIYTSQNEIFLAGNTFSNCPLPLRDTVSGSIQLVSGYGEQPFRPSTYTFRLVSIAFGVPNILAQISFQYTTVPSPLIAIYGEIPNSCITSGGPVCDWRTYYLPMVGSGFTPYGQAIITVIGPSPSTVTQYTVMAGGGPYNSGIWNINIESLTNMVYLPPPGTYVIQATDVATGTKSNVIVVISHSSTFDPSTVATITSNTIVQVPETVSCPIVQPTSPMLNTLPSSTTKPAPILVTGSTFIANGQVIIMVAADPTPIQYATRADFAGSISFSIDTSSIPLGPHSIVACNSPIVDDTSFSCPNGISNTVVTNVLAQAASAVNATFYALSAGQPDWVILGDQGQTKLISPVQFKMVVTQGSISAAQMLIDGQAYDLNIYGASSYESEPITLGQGSHTLHFDYKSPSGGPWNTLAIISLGIPSGAQSDSNTLISLGVLALVIAVVIVVWKHRQG